MGTANTKPRANAPEGAILKRGPHSGFPEDVTAADKSGCSPREGPLSKQNRRGLWQSRLFKLSNQYLVYFEAKGAVVTASMIPMAAINLELVSAVEATDLSAGEFELQFVDGTSYKLRSPNGDPRLADAWTDAIDERLKYAAKTARLKAANARAAADRDGGGSSAGAGKGGKGKGRGNRGRGMSDEEEADDRRGRGGGFVAGAAGAGVGGRGNNNNNTLDVGEEEDALAVKKSHLAFEGRKDSDDEAAAGAGGKGGKGAGAARRGRGAADTDDDEDGGSSAPVRKPSSAAVNSGSGGNSEDLIDGGASGGGAGKAGLGASASFAHGSSDRGRSSSPVRGLASAATAPGGGLRSLSTRRPQAAGSDDDEDAAAGSRGRRRGSVDDDDDDDDDGGRGRRGHRGAASNGGGKKPAAAAAAAGAPSKRGWVFVRPTTRFGREQRWYLTLQGGFLIMSSDDDYTKSAVSTEDVCDILTVMPSTTGHKGGFSILSKGDKHKRKFRVEDDAQANEWIKALRSAKDYKIAKAAAKASGSGEGGGAGGGSKKLSTTVGGRGDSARDIPSSSSAAGRSRSAAPDQFRKGGLSAAAAGRGGGRRRRSTGGDGSDLDDDLDGEAADSDYDEDEDEGLPPPPRWFANYDRASKDKDRDAIWMEMSVKWFEGLFQGIYDSPGSSSSDGSSSDAVRTDSDPDHKVVISRLEEATTAACAQFLERVRECRSRTRPDLLKHLVMMFDLKFLSCLNLLTTGDTPSRLSPLQLLQVIDCIEGFLRVRSNAVGQLQLTAQENRPGQMLLESRRGLIETYVNIMLPRLQAITDKVLNNLLARRADIVAPMMNQRLGTTSPADLFTLMSEHLKIAKQGGSLTLQRKLLSLLMGEIARYSGQILLSHMEEWAKTPDTVDLDYVTACINDAGTMLDLLEQLEADFAPALAQVSAQAGSQISRLESRVGMDTLPTALAQIQDDFDREEEEQAREDLAAIAQDIPRARNELKKCGTQLTGILLDIISDNLKAHFGKLFCGDWLKENVVTSICNIASEYVSELQSILDTPWQEVLFGWVLSAIVAHYTVRLINPEQAVKISPNTKFGGGFGRWFKLTDESLTKIVSDELEVSQTFSLYLGNENRTLIMQSLHTAREMLTSDPSILLDIFEMALRSHPAVSVETFLMFEKAVTLRSDYASSGTGSFISKADRKKLIEDAKKLCFSYGQPLDDAEELLAMTDAYGRGVAITSGAAMASGHVWDPDSVTDTVMRVLFPQTAAMAKSKELFKGWVPPASPSREEPVSAATFGLGGGASGGGGGAGGGGAGDDKPASFNLSDFTGKGGAGAGAAPVAASAGGGGVTSGNAGAFGLGSSFKAVAVDDDDDDGGRRRKMKSNSSKTAAAPAPAPAPAPPPPEEKPKNAFLSSGGGAGRRRRGRDDDDDD